ncbi:MAG: hypothetical protein SFV53_05100 [Rickettsiales bacterium]|nr:hypothetical protein [Rickettsiales bacterium]
MKKYSNYESKLEEISGQLERTLEQLIKVVSNNSPLSNEELIELKTKVTKRIQSISESDKLKVLLDNANSGKKLSTENLEKLFVAAIKDEKLSLEQLKELIIFFAKNGDVAPALTLINKASEQITYEINYEFNHHDNLKGIFSDVFKDFFGENFVVHNMTSALKSLSDVVADPQFLNNYNSNKKKGEETPEETPNNKSVKITEASQLDNSKESEEKVK